jgi:hypothetical protein
MENTDVFVSYGRGDDELFTKRLYGDLTSRGCKLWWRPSRDAKPRAHLHAGEKKLLAESLLENEVTREALRRKW